mmetsp:Transcript_18014/g.60766  ORF Transcript_18014/g.60766 Transcript_18014/m.60766 type:complete len:253 (-) Transcript_18014:89-847(-)
MIHPPLKGLRDEPRQRDAAKGPRLGAVADVSLIVHGVNLQRRKTVHEVVLRLPRKRHPVLLVDVLRAVIQIAAQQTRPEIRAPLLQPRARRHGGGAGVDGDARVGHLVGPRLLRPRPVDHHHVPLCRPEQSRVRLPVGRVAAAPLFRTVCCQRGSAVEKRHPAIFSDGVKPKHARRKRRRPRHDGAALGRLFPSLSEAVECARRDEDEGFGDEKSRRVENSCSAILESAALQQDVWPFPEIVVEDARMAERV